MSIIQWFIQSSANPQALALSARALLVAVVPTVLAIAPLVGIDPVFAQGWLTDFIGGVEQFVFYTFSLVAAVMFLYGMVRKLLLTAKNRFK